MRRSSQLAVLSREHHLALELALRLQRATSADADVIVAAVCDFWEREGRDHFRMEEEVLLPALARHVDVHDSDIVRVLVEHVDIRRRIADLGGPRTASVADVVALGEALRDHVRFEERTLFGRVESILPADELERVGAALHNAGGPPRA